MLDMIKFPNEIKETFIDTDLQCVYLLSACGEIRPPENNLKQCWSCDSIFVPHDSDKSQLVEVLNDGEVSLDVSWHFMELYAYLCHIGEGPTGKLREGFGMTESHFRIINVANLSNHCIIESRSAPSTSTLKGYFSNMRT